MVGCVTGTATIQTPVSTGWKRSLKDYTNQRFTESVSIDGATKRADVTGEGSIVSGVAGRYAAALFELAVESKSHDAVGDDLSAIGTMIDDSDDLRRMVRSPVFSADKQGAAFAKILDKAGIGGLTANFVGLVARNRRLFALRDMIRAYGALLARHRGEVSADVVSAHTLNDAQTTALKDAIKSALGKDVQVSTRVDPALLGGLVVKVGSRMIDTSLRTKLNSMKIAMKEVG